MGGDGHEHGRGPVHGHDHHGHGHDHDHDHDHDNDHHDRRPSPTSHETILFLDAPSGLAGDMIVAALVDLGVPVRVVEEALGALPLQGFRATFGRRERSGIVGRSFDVEVDEGQPLRDYASIRAMLDHAKLADGVKERAHKTFYKLATAEAKVHSTSIDAVHFHEVGAVDAIVDIVGAAAALDYIGARLVVSPLPMGRGYVRAAHGVLPLPAPAVVECLAGFTTYDAGIEFELVTPTGAAIVGAHAEGSQRWPSMAPERVGWGAGRADLADRPNVLRAVLGTALAGGRSPTHTVLEANIDDATGELVASWMEALLGAGALDVWATPITMKKGRPALTLSALTTTSGADALAAAMLRETTSLGVRRTEVTRTERPRRVEEVETPYGTIPVKIAEGPFGSPQTKPEFDACARAARAHGVPVREVLAAALLAASGARRASRP